VLLFVIEFDPVGFHAEKFKPMPTDKAELSPFIPTERNWGIIPQAHWHQNIELRVLSKQTIIHAFSKFSKLVEIEGHLTHEFVTYETQDRT
jgi:hypothetical protein